MRILSKLPRSSGRAPARSLIDLWSSKGQCVPLAMRHTTVD